MKPACANRKAPRESSIERSTKLSLRHIAFDGTLSTCGNACM
jgi:hypothetical protein